MLVAECPECRDFSRFTLSAVRYPALPLPEELEGALGPSGLAWTCPHCGVVTAMENLVVTGGSVPPKEIDPEAYYIHSPLTLVALSGPYPTQRDASVAIDSLLRPVLGEFLSSAYERVGRNDPRGRDIMVRAEAEVESGNPAVPGLPPHSPKGMTVATNREVVDALEAQAPYPERPEDYPAPTEQRPIQVQRSGRPIASARNGAPKVRKRAERLVELVEGAVVVEHGGEELGTIQRLEDRQLKGVWAHVTWQSGETTTCPLSALSPAPGGEEQVDYDQVDIGARVSEEQETVVVPEGTQADPSLFLI